MPQVEANLVAKILKSGKLLPPTGTINKHNSKKKNGSLSAGNFRSRYAGTNKSLHLPSFTINL